MGKLTLIRVSERTYERDGFRGFQRYSGVGGVRGFPAIPEISMGCLAS